MAKQAGLFQLGIDLAGQPSSAQTEAAQVTYSESTEEQRDNNVVHISTVPGDSSAQEHWPASDHDNDHFITRNGKVFAGEHLIIDLWDASRLDDIEHIEAALTTAVHAAKATLLHIHLHHFTPNGGVSGVAVLAESHISIHTWPERNYAALDVFMCGDSEPAKTIPILRQAFQPGRVVVNELLRGDVDMDS
ncbi:MAG TPA: adenosylmethionine decarboxylase [Rhodospirillaceae bacterium]|nr:adenosylmethionine decarboxylase [Alphaproteobacteria bacterium]OUT41422.1 MAG: adenosylmethionine decarboxylase [Micavibrio sp. TMED2]HCI46665.1 adenosylmethionine decarboxylase [Rhodospirillaceae bacterium]MAS47031.1 adenosylmethionine decarboxylase [Alphaproteobacteria bacterium]MAX95125.1 adenosylmethionine decarboxylase [Alphaproteobacteria bacterium]